MSNYVYLIALCFSVLIFVGCGDSDEASSTAEIDRTLNANLGGSSGDDDLPNRTPNENENTDIADQNDGQGSSTSNMVSTRSALFPELMSRNATGGSSAAGFGGALFPNPDAEATADNPGRGAPVNTAVAGSEPSDSDPFDLGNEVGSSPIDPPSVPIADTAPAAESSVSLLLDAKRLFERHNEQAAVSYVYANHLVSDEARKNYQLNWYPGLKEPRLFFRWGVGVIFNKPSNFDGRHPVIGDPGDENEGVSQSSRVRNRGGGQGRLGAPAAGGGGGGARGTRTYKNVDTNRPDGFLLYYTGDFGEKLINYLDSRRADDDAPYYGQILKDVMEVQAPEKQEDSSDQARSGRVGRQNPAAPASNFGSVGGGDATGRGRGNSNAQPLQRTDTSIIERASGNSTAQAPEDDLTGSIIPGVQLLGKGSKRDLIERARQANVDTLILFNVKISKSRGSRNRQNSAPSSTNITSMKIVDVKTDDNIYSSKSLKDTDVSDDNADGEDPIKEQVEKAFSAFADKQFKAIKLPDSINENNVKSRIGSLLKSKTDLLRSAVEVVSFYEANLLSEKLANTAITRLFDDEDAVVLITGSPLDRLNFLRDKLPEGPGE